MPIGNWIDRFIENRKLWIAASIVALSVHIFAVVHTAVDVPIFDEWEFFVHKTYGDWGSWNWFWGFHNEHRIVFTKILFWLAQATGRLDFYLLQVVNIFLYTALLATLYVGIRREYPSTRGLEAFFFFLTSAICSENIAWSFQSQFHGCFLFFALALICLTSKKTLIKGLGVFWAIASVYSLSAGVLLVVALCLFYPIWEGGSFRFQLRRFACVSAPIIASLLLWSLNYPNPKHHPKFYWPWTINFWGHFSGTFGWLVGSDGLNAGPVIASFVVFSFLSIFVVKEFFSRVRRPSESPQTGFGLTVFITGFLLMLASVSMGRAGQGTGQGKAGRYAEMVVLLLPFAFVVLKTWPRALVATWGPRILWALCAWGYFDNFRFFDVYEGRARFAQSQIDCLIDAAPTYCPGGYPILEEERLAYARRLGARFVTQIPERN